MHKSKERERIVLNKNTPITEGIFFAHLTTKRRLEFHRVATDRTQESYRRLGR
jgi:hypothetical protein